ncbi:MAG: glycerol kinase GlpK [Rhodospirillales bacterium]
MAEEYVLSIDQGTTGSTVLIFDRDANVKGRAYSEFTQHFPKPGWVEHDAEEIWTVTLGVIEAALEKSGIGASALNAIGITNQRETTVLWERATGRPVARAIVWQDRRTAPFCEELKAKGFEELVRQKTGLVIDPYFSGTKIKWLLDSIPGLRTRAERGEIAFGTIDSWLVWHLTGGAAHVTDYSNASRTLLFNINDLTWDDELLHLLDVPRAILPEVMPSSHIYGHTDPEKFFGTHKIPVSGIAGDQQAALFGQACYGEGLAKNTYGTGSFVLMNTGNEVVRSKHNLLTTIAWKIGDEPVEYALEGAIFITGAGVQWLRDGLGIIERAAETEEMASSLQSNDDVYFVPALVGLGAPHWDPYARGALMGVTRGPLGHTSYAQCWKRSATRRATSSRRCSGTWASCSRAPLRRRRLRQRLLMQFQSDILGVPVEVPEVSETTALGAAYLAGLATGYWSDRSEINAKWRLARRYVPTMEAGERARLYRKWAMAVERVKNWARAEADLEKAV